MAYYREAIKQNPTKIVEWEMYVKPGEYTFIEKSLVRVVAVHSDDNTVAIQTLSDNGDGSVSVVSNIMDRELFSKCYVRFIDVENAFVSHFGTYYVRKAMNEFVNFGRIPTHFKSEPDEMYKTTFSNHVYQKSYGNSMKDGDIIIEVYDEGAGISHLNKKYIADSDSTHLSNNRYPYTYPISEYNEYYIVRSHWLPELSHIYEYTFNCSFIK